MKQVHVIDAKGYVHLYTVRDDDPEELAAEIGVPLEPPDVEHLDWEAIKRDLHNTLVERNYMCWEDAMRSQNGLNAVAQAVLKGRLVRLYRSAAISSREND